jgi:hypothetical protein
MRAQDFSPSSIFFWLPRSVFLEGWSEVWYGFCITRRPLAHCESWRQHHTVDVRTVIPKLGLLLLSSSQGEIGCRPGTS